MAAQTEKMDIPMPPLPPPKEKETAPPLPSLLLPPPPPPPEEPKDAVSSNASVNVDQQQQQIQAQQIAQYQMWCQQQQQYQYYQQHQQQYSASYGPYGFYGRYPMPFDAGIMGNNPWYQAQPQQASYSNQNSWSSSGNSNSDSYAQSSESNNQSTSKEQSKNSVERTQRQISKEQQMSESYTASTTNGNYFDTLANNSSSGYYKENKDSGSRQQRDVFPKYRQPQDVSRIQFNLPKKLPNSSTLAGLKASIVRSQRPRMDTPSSHGFHSGMHNSVSAPLIRENQQFNNTTMKGNQASNKSSENINAMDSTDSQKLSPATENQKSAAAAGEWPEGVKKYVQRCFSSVDSNERDLMESRLKDKLTHVFQNKLTDSIDWDNEPPPFQPQRKSTGRWNNRDNNWPVSKRGRYRPDLLSPDSRLSLNELGKRDLTSGKKSNTDRSRSRSRSGSYSSDSISSRSLSRSPSPRRLDYRHDLK